MARSRLRVECPVGRTDSSHRGKNCWKAENPLSLVDYASHSALFGLRLALPAALA